MSNAAQKANPTKARTKPGAKAKRDVIMIRVDAVEKALVDAAAGREYAKTSTWVRQQVLKLAHGWKLIPPPE